jgi:hypothetical protein
VSGEALVVEHVRWMGVPRHLVACVDAGDRPAEIGGGIPGGTMDGPGVVEDGIARPGLCDQPIVSVVFGIEIGLVLECRFPVRVGNLRNSLETRWVVNSSPFMRAPEILNGSGVGV